MNLSNQSSPISSGNSSARSLALVRAWPLLLLAGGFLIYASSMTIWYVGDDFQYFWAEPSRHLVRYFVEPNPNHGFYRPVNTMINAATQVLFGWSTWPIHLINILFHALLAWTLFRFMRREGFGDGAAMIGSGFLLASQVGAAAVLQTDTFSQIAGTCFGVWSLLLMHRAYNPASERRLLLYLASLGSMALSLASKETSVAYLPMIALILWLRPASSFTARLFACMRDALPFVLLGILYLWWRWAIGLSQPGGEEGTYAYVFGTNILRNLVQLVVALTTPLSTVRGFDAIVDRDPVMLALLAIGCGGLIMSTLYGLLRAKNVPSLLRVVGLMAILAFLPVYPLHHVGELYAYNALPFVAVIIGAGLGEVYRRAWRLRWTALVAVIGAALYLAANILAIHEKGEMLREEGERARRMIGAITPVIRSLPDGAELILLNPPGAPPDYSVYRQKGFDVFEWGTHVFEVVTGRTDVRYRLVDTLPPPSSRPRVVLTLHGDSVVPYHERPSIDR